MEVIVNHINLSDLHKKVQNFQIFNIISTILIIFWTITDLFQKI